MKKGSKLFGRGHRLSKPNPDSGTLNWADLTLCVASIMVVRADKFNFIPTFPYKEGVITAVAIVLILLSFYRYYHKLCPISRWRRSSWATGMVAATWTAVPLILYATGVSDNWERMWQMSAWSAVMWIAFIFCYYKFVRTKQRTKATVAMIEWKIRNNKGRR